MKNVERLLRRDERPPRNDGSEGTYSFTDPKVVNALDAKTGELKWKFSGASYFWSSPAFADGVVYIGGMYYSSPFFYAIDAQTGLEKWKLSTGKTLEKGSSLSGVVSSPAVDDGPVFFGGLDGKFYAVSR